MTAFIAIEKHEALPLSEADLPDLMTRAELAEFTGVSMSTLATWAVEKKGPPMKKLGRSVRYRKADVLAWLEQA